MADIRESFPTLIDGTGAGVSASGVQTGTVIGTKTGALVFGFRDSSGNAIAPALDAAGRLGVTTAAVGTAKRARGENTTGSLTPVAVATLTLVAGKVYADVSILVSCRRDALYQLIQNDNGTETVLADIILGPGQFTFGEEFDQLSFTAGATGTQQLIVRGQNFSNLSNLRASVHCLELA
jgi:hypothetical protein